MPAVLHHQLECQNTHQPDSDVDVEISANKTRVECTSTTAINIKQQQGNRRLLLKRVQTGVVMAMVSPEDCVSVSSHVKQIPHA